MKRIIIMGSPRSNGRSAHLAEALFEANIDERPEDELLLVPISEIEVGPCIACNACREKMEITLRDAQGNEVRELRHRCVFDDDMQALYDLIDDADELTVVSPVFFSGAPSLLKALLDRLQPYYWANWANRAGGDAGEKGHAREMRAKRPATLHVIGEGGDPHGYDALVSEVKSALAVAGFRLERIFDWVGKIDETGEIIADAEETILVKPGKPQQGQREQQKERPKLDLSSNGGGKSGKSGSSANKAKRRG